MLKILLLFYSTLCLAARPHSPHSIRPVDSSGPVTQTFRSFDVPKEYEAIVRLEFPGGSICTGVHLGDGWILTADHCFKYMRKILGRYPDITVALPGLRRKYGPFSFGDYRLYIPNAESSAPMHTADGTVFLGQKPDLALFRVPIRYQMSDVAKVEIPSTEKLKEEQEGVFIGGYGESAEGLRNFEHLKVGAAFINWPGKETFLLNQTDFNGKKYAISLPGNSGGPLFTKNPNGTLTVFGIFSEYYLGGSIHDGTPSYNNTYTRLDEGAGHDWILKVLARIR